MRILSGVLALIIVSCASAGAEPSKAWHMKSIPVDKGFTAIGPNIFIGEYYTFGYLSKARLFAAHFVNPELATSAKVVNWYSFSDVSRVLALDKIWSAYQSGDIKLSVKHEQKSTYQVVQTSLGYRVGEWKPPRNRQKQFELHVFYANSVSDPDSTIAVLKKISFKNEVYFKKSLSKLRASDPSLYSRLGWVTENMKWAGGITPGARIISWDTVSGSEIAVYAGSMRPTKKE